jgi:UDP-N-acetylmuramoylalanine--D-glutamate ligase
VVNADDPTVLAQAQRGRARLLPFRSSGAIGGDAAFFENRAAWLRLGETSETLFSLDSVRLPGAHLAADLLAAAAMARLLGVPAGAIARAVAAFEGVEHVLERVATLDGVGYFNDSKATNVDAARKSLEAFEQPLVVLMGGRYKGGDFASLRELVAARVRTVIALGEAQDRIVTALADATQVVRASSLRDAVAQARRAARAGDVVLLAPACSSFDMFRDYAERGRAFKAEVRRLATTPAEENPNG